MSPTTTERNREQMFENAGPGSEGFDRWMRSRNLSRTTRCTYRKHLRQVVRLGNGLDPASWSPSDCQMMKEGAREGDDDPMLWLDYQISTQQQYHSALKLYWRYTKRHDLVNDDENLDFWVLGKRRQATCDDIRALTMPESDVDALREYCENTILHSMNPHKVYTAFQAWMMLSYGIRAVGLTHFHMMDLDVADKSVYVRRTKNNSSRRSIMDVDPVPFQPRFEWARRRILKGIAKRFPDMGGECQRYIDDPNTLMFFIRTRTAGAGLLKPSGGSIKCAFRRTTKAALGEEWGTHSVRHSKIFRLLEVENWRPHIVQVYAGHRNVEQTLRYCPIGLEEQREELKRNGKGPVEHGAPPPDRAELRAAYRTMYRGSKMTAEEFISALEKEGLI